MYRYVRVDSDGIPQCDYWVEIRESPEKDLIEIEPSFNLSNKKYVDGEWTDINSTPEWEKNLIDEEVEAQLEMQTNIQYLVDLAEIEMEG